MEAANDQPHAIDIPSSALTTSTPSAALASIERLEARATEALLVQEVRQAVVGTAGTAAGAGVAGFFATTILPTTLEDLLALALASAVGYVSVVNLPLRRAEAKRRLEELTLGILEARCVVVAVLWEGGLSFSVGLGGWRKKEGWHLDDTAHCSFAWRSCVCHRIPTSQQQSTGP